MRSDDSFLVLKVEDLRAYHTSRSGLVRAVDGVSFEIRRGEAMGLLGESGAGKTSVALAILGVFDEVSRRYASSSGDEENKRLWKLRDEARERGVTSREMGTELPGVEGHVWFLGRDLVGLDENEYQRVRGNDITYVPQGTRMSLNPYTTVGLQIAESMKAHDEEDELSDREILRRVLQALNFTELSEAELRKDLKPSQFSQGEDQRVMIAMALVTNPALIILDEPTTGLDAVIKRQVLSAIGIIKEKTDLSLMILSNDIGVVAETADRVGVMTGGRLVELGDVRDVLGSPGHPFTRAMLMSSPSMEMMRRIRQRNLRLRGIPGGPPDVTRLHPGCIFRERCEYVTDHCRRVRPDFREVRPGHWVACHRYEELPEW
ncbi:MAG: ABC transporter ATP-binding protein [Candidatus Thorarchaeota archaeon]